MCAAVVNFCLKHSVELHDTLHEFRESQVTGTATLEAKLSQQISRLAYEPLFQDFSYVCKAYYPLDRGRCLEILRRYGLGPNLARLLTTIGTDRGLTPSPP